MDMDDTEARAPKLRVVTRRKDFAQAVLARAGGGKAGPKAVMDATLAELARVLSEGGDLVLPPLGRVRLAKEKYGKSGRVLTLRLTLSGATGGEDDAGADDAGGDPDGSGPDDAAAGGRPAKAPLQGRGRKAKAPTDG